MGKELKAWGVRRREIDMDKLALAYYMLARAIIEEQRATPTKGGRSESAKIPPEHGRREAA